MKIHRIPKPYYIRNFRRKLKPRVYDVPTEDWAMLRYCADEDINFILDTLKKLKSGEMKPEDYGVYGKLIWVKRTNRYKKSYNNTKREKKFKPKFIMQEPTLEETIKDAASQPSSPQTIKEESKTEIVVPAIDKRAFIEGEFTIVDKDNKEVPFRLNGVQEKYYETLVNEYSKSLNGAREIILKARQEGFSSLILAMFATDFITIPNSVSICISHDRAATEKLFRKVHHYIESYCQKNGFSVKEYLSVDTKSELENATNKAFFYIKTAGSKVGARGGTALNIHFSEAAFFESTEKVTATEIIEASVQQVPQGKGMIFLESTGGDYGTYFQMAWEKAKRKEIVYRPRFFSWEEMYSDDYIEKKRLEYQTEEKFLTDYPRTDEEAFIHTGSPFFDRKILKWMRDNIQREPLRMGRLAMDGELI